MTSLYGYRRHSTLALFQSADLNQLGNHWAAPMRCAPVFIPKESQGFQFHDMFQ